VLWKRNNLRGENKAPRRTLRWNFAARYATSFSRSVHAVEFMRESRKQPSRCSSCLFLVFAASGAETRAEERKRPIALGRASTIINYLFRHRDSAIGVPVLSLLPFESRDVTDIEAHFVDLIDLTNRVRVAKYR